MPLCIADSCAVFRAAVRRTDFGHKLTFQCPKEKRCYRPLHKRRNKRMRRCGIQNIIFAITITLSGCAANPSSSVPAEKTPSGLAHDNTRSGVGAATPLPDGAWVGLVSVTDSRDQHNDKPWDISFVLYSCNGSLRYYLGDVDGSRFTTPDPELSVQSYHGSHHLFFEHEGTDEDNPKHGWVEMQAADLIELSSALVKIRWTRAISNRDTAMTHPSRAIFTQGIGTLRRHGNGCPREALERVKESIFIPPVLQD